MEKLEFHTDPYGILYYRTESGEDKKLTLFDTKIIDNILSIVKERFPNCHTALESLYPRKNGTKPAIMRQRYMMAQRFIRCNFGEYDIVSMDVDHAVIHFEGVRCPLKGGMCPYENIICNPKGRASLSALEKEVAALYAEGITFRDIAGCLDRKPNTIKTVLHRIKIKLNLKNSRGIIKEVRMNNLI